MKFYCCYKKRKIRFIGIEIQITKQREEKTQNHLQAKYNPLIQILLSKKIRSISNESDRQKCFIITPIGNQIVRRIISDDLVVANLTGNNPNVMYELAIRHMTAKPIVTICENGTILPFDIKDSRTIFYKDDMLGTQELKNAFESFVTDIDYSSCYKDNPIYNAVNNFSGISIPNKKQSAKLTFSLTTNGNQLEDDAILYHCKEAALEKCNVVAYEVGGRTISGEIDLVLPHLQSDFRA